MGVWDFKGHRNLFTSLGGFRVRGCEKPLCLRTRKPSERGSRRRQSSPSKRGSRRPKPCRRDLSHRPVLTRVCRKTRCTQWNPSTPTPTSRPPGTKVVEWTRPRRSGWDRTRRVGQPSSFSLSMWNSRPVTERELYRVCRGSCINPGSIHTQISTSSDSLRMSDSVRLSLPSV